MDFSAYGQLFIIGFFLGCGPCLFHTGPILMPYIAGTKKGFWEGMRAVLVFSLGRLLVYVVFCVLAAVSGKALGVILYSDKIKNIIDFILILLILVMGIVVLMKDSKWCDTIQQHDTSSLFALGIFPIFLNFR